MPETSEIQVLIERFQNKDRIALSRLVTFISRGQYWDEIKNAIDETKSESKVVALTGNSGVGKSSLVNQLISEIRNRNQSVAVLACDPQSSISGGALLGDRVRMSNNPNDAKVWIRSLATISGRQAISEHLDLMSTMLINFGFDWILIETVGAGQGDVAVRQIADVVCLLVQPGIGDDLQWEKAGVLEIADIVVVHKGDLPQAAATEAQVRELLNLPGCAKKPVIRVSSKSQQGIDKLWDMISETQNQSPCRVEIPKASAAAELVNLAQELITQNCAYHSSEVEQIAQRWQSGELETLAAIGELLERCLLNKDN